MKTTTTTIGFNATAARVWQAVTQPDQVKQWQYGAHLITDWTVGHSIRFRNEWEGTVFEQWGTVLTFDPDRELSYSLFFPRPGLEDVPENYFTMTYRLSAEEERTILTIVQDDPRPSTSPEESDEEENPALAALRNLIEG